MVKQVSYRISGSLDKRKLDKSWPNHQTIQHKAMIISKNKPLYYLILYAVGTKENQIKIILEML